MLTMNEARSVSLKGLDQIVDQRCCVTGNGDLSYQAGFDDCSLNAKEHHASIDKYKRLLLPTPNVVS